MYMYRQKALALDYMKIKQPFAAGHMSSISIYIYTVSTKNEHISYIHRHVSALYMFINDFLQVTATTPPLQKTIWALMRENLTKFTLYLIETPFNTFANRADPDQATLLRELPDQGLLCLLMEI